MILLNEIWDFIAKDEVFPVVISALTTIIVFFLTLFTKNFIERRVLSSKLETEHKFDQRKKIKEVLARHKVHLLSACEELNHRMWNFANNHDKKWLNVKGNYVVENYYFHSFIYRILSVYAWIKIIQKDMIFLDTTIASKEDLEFIKFLRLFPQVFCDLTFIEGNSADGENATDHFFKNNFNILPDSLIRDDGLTSYSLFVEDLGVLRGNLSSIYRFMDNISPIESRKRWDRLHLLNLLLIIFLNQYGYDFQKTSKNKIRQALTKPKISSCLENFFCLLQEYRLDKNKEVSKMRKIAKKHYKE